MREGGRKGGRERERETKSACAREKMRTHARTHIHTRTHTHTQTHLGFSNIWALKICATLLAGSPSFVFPHKKKRKIILDLNKTPRNLQGRKKIERKRVFLG